MRCGGYFAMRALFLFAIIIFGAAAPVWPLDQPNERDPRLLEVENFLIARFDEELGLVRESPDPTIDRTYWLLSDNLLAYHALKDSHPEIAGKISQTLQEYGYWNDGLHEALFGEEIPLPPYTSQVIVIENTSDWLIKTEARVNGDGSKIMDDWAEYADILLYASLGFYNRGDLDSAVYYYQKTALMWNEAGLYDKPTQQDGFYTTHKLALLLYVSHVLNQTLPYRSRLEERIWQFQREDGGIRSHYLGNLTSNREANSETAALVLICYNYEAKKLQRIREVEEVARLEQEKEAKKWRLLGLATIVLGLIVAAMAVIYRKWRGSQNA